MKEIPASKRQLLIELVSQLSPEQVKKVNAFLDDLENQDAMKSS